MDNNMYKIKQHKNRRFNVSEYLKNVDVERIRLRKSIDDYLKHLKEEELIDSHKEYVFALQEMYGYELNQSFKDMKKEETVFDLHDLYMVNKELETRAQNTSFLQRAENLVDKIMTMFKLNKMYYQKHSFYETFCCFSGIKPQFEYV